MNLKTNNLREYQFATDADFKITKEASGNCLFEPTSKDWRLTARAQHTNVRADIEYVDTPNLGRHPRITAYQIEIEFFNVNPLAVAFSGVVSAEVVHADAKIAEFPKGDLGPRDNFMARDPGPVPFKKLTFFAKDLSSSCLLDIVAMYTKTDPSDL